MKTKTSNSSRPGVRPVIERKIANVITGGEVYISTEHARMMYDMTTIDDPCNERNLVDYNHGDKMVKVDNEFFHKLMDARTILRKISKSILITSGEIDTMASFIESLNAKQPMPDREPEEYSE